VRAVHRLRTLVDRRITLGVRVMAFDEGRVVLVRHTYMPGWYFPGGGLKRRESLEAAARREALEEAGVTLRDLEFVGIYSNFGREVESMTGDFDHEIAEVGVFALNDLPGGLHPATARRLGEYRDGHATPTGRW
jgi:8-oxo-dGTP pyrophosphatase MutT (NUDIX family)